jgi:hypothetical protein
MKLSHRQTNCNSSAGGGNSVAMVADYSYVFRAPNKNIIQVSEEFGQPVKDPGNPADRQAYLGWAAV